jgi:hypothetical protein
MSHHYIYISKIFIIKKIEKIKNREDLNSLIKIFNYWEISIFKILGKFILYLKEQQLKFINKNKIK